MRILYHHRTNGDGAEGIHVAEIVAALRELGHEVQLICPRSARREPGLKEASPRSLSSQLTRVRPTKSGDTSDQTTSQPAKLPSASGQQSTSRPPQKMPARIKQSLELAYNTVSYHRARQAIRDFQPDLVYERYSSYNFGGVWAARAAGVPLILEVNATYAGEFGSSFPVAYPRSLDRIERYVLGKASGIIAVSQALKASIVQQGVAPERIRVSPNAINVHKVSAANRTADRQAIRDRFGWTDQHTVIGFVGSLRHWHGIDLLAAAIPEIHRRAPQARFSIVGTGECWGELSDMIHREQLESVVQMVGAVPHQQVFPFMSAMDIGVMPDSNPFGSPMKVLEYMAMQVVPVAPALGPLQEIINDNVTGKLFTQRSTTSFVDAIVGLCHDTHKRTVMALQAHDYVLRERTWLHNARDIIDLFHQIKPTAIESREVIA